MEPVNFYMPGYTINEYLLVLTPHEELRNKIMEIKKEFGSKYKTVVAVKSKPHLTLVNFVSLAMMEEKIIQRFQAIARSMAPFKVELKDYGSLPSHSIFINVISKLPVQSLVKELKNAQRLLKLNKETRPHFIDDPQLIICRKLKPWQYEEGWLEYCHRQFTARFIADSMLLLKRPSGEKTAFQIAKRFDFMNLPVATKQGNLFSPGQGT